MSSVDSLAQKLKDCFLRRKESKDAVLLNLYSNTVRGYFVGYKYICVSDRNSVQAIQEGQQWCNKNCEGGWHRGLFRVSATADGKDWEFNDITGGDISFWAFHNEEDAVMFMLTRNA